jgi:hypothetical protein
MMTAITHDNDENDDDNSVLHCIAYLIGKAANISINTSYNRSV